MEPACTHSETETVLMPPGSRQYGRVLCKKCKRFLRWAPTPTVPLEELHIPDLVGAGEELPPLTGSRAQIDWAMSIRCSLLDRLEVWSEGVPLRRRAYLAAQDIVDAAWWIANKDASPDAVKWPKAWLTPPAPKPVPEAKMAPPLPPVRRATPPPQPALTLPSEALDPSLADMDSRPVRRSARPAYLRPTPPAFPRRAEPELPPEAPAPSVAAQTLRRIVASAPPRSFSAAPAPSPVEERPFLVELTPCENGLHQLFVSFDGRSGGTLRMLPEEVQTLHRHLSEYLTKLSNKPELDE